MENDMNDYTKQVLEKSIKLLNRHLADYNLEVIEQRATLEESERAVVRTIQQILDLKASLDA